MLIAKPQRITGFDLIRLISFWIISYYHFVYAVWHDRLPEYERVMSTQPLFWNAVYPVLRSLSFSGHSVLFLTAILIALANKSFVTTLRLCAFLACAWIAFVWAENGFSSFHPYWDIHLLILSGVLGSAFLERGGRRWVLLAGLLGFVATCFSFWKFESLQALPLWSRHALIGDCENEISSWPILPWLGFFFAGYASGAVLRSKNVRAALATWKPIEKAGWIFVLAAALPFLGAFYRLKALEDWECHAFRVPPFEFWAHFVFVLFAMRISLLDRVNAHLTPRLRWVTDLNISRHFFLAYALQYIFAFYLAVFFGDHLRSQPNLFTFAGFMMLPMAEIFAHVAHRMGLTKIFKGHSPQLNPSPDATSEKRR